MKKYFFLFLFVSMLFSCTTKKTVSTTKSPDNKILKKWIKPPNLKKGDTIAILSPASQLKDSIHSISKALDTLKSWQLNYKLYPHIYHSKGHFAGTDKQRALDFQNAINNPNIKAIWCTRGGYGSVRILDKLNYKALKTNPKWIIGYSDITAIHNDLHNFGIQSIHGMMPVSFKNPADDKIPAINSLKNSLFGKKNEFYIKNSSYNKDGNSKGVLVGGNLSLLASMLGSKSDLNTKGKIIFIEDVGEKKYQIDRMLYSLKRAGYFEHCNGLIVGSFSSVKKNSPQFGKEVEEIILELLQEYNFPILFNFPVGHINDNRALIIGAEVQLNTIGDKSFVKFL